MSFDKAAGLLFGLALGDALGAPVEFRTLPQIKAAFGQSGIQEPPDPALYTDDTQMTLALTEGLLMAGLNALLDEQMTTVGRRFIEWRHSPENNRAPGAACLNGVARFESGVSWSEAGCVNSKGCGSAMRVATIGYLYQHDEARLRELAAASSLITHRHPTAIAAALVAAYAVKLALDGTPPGDYLRLMMSFTDGMSDEMDDALRRIGHVGAWTDEEAALDHIGQGWTGEEAVALALYCVVRYPDDYPACMRRAANTNGDSDSIACIAGGIMGARLGVDAIPAEWRERCENASYLATLAARMVEARAILTSTHEG
jgi:ADP-ribosylglycohydrolase